MMNNAFTASNTDIFSESFNQLTLRIHALLNQNLPNHSRLEQAIRYSVLNGGKRLRPLLTYTAGLLFTKDLTQLDIPAVAVELIHCYSLIHDDLPSMDNDDYRRGQLTCHKAFDEATAILAGDALQCLAFEWITKSSTLSPQSKIAILATLAQASGIGGMCAGQALDLQAQGKPITVEDLERIHQLKTGALIKASIRIGAIAAECQNENILNGLDQFAERIGLAFQIQDDILNIEGDHKTIGKNTGTDALRDKPTYPALTSVAYAKQRVKTLTLEAQDLLKKINGNSQLLEELALSLIHRNK